MSSPMFLLDLAEALGNVSKADDSYGAPYAMTEDEIIDAIYDLRVERDEYKRMFVHAADRLAKFIPELREARTMSTAPILCHDTEKLAKAWDEGYSAAFHCDTKFTDSPNPYKASK